VAFKSSRGRETGKELQVWSSANTGQTVGGAGGAAVPVSVTTGGNVDGLEPGNGYVYHTFTSPGTFVLSGDPINADILVVAGGGGGGGGNVFSPTTSGGGGGGVAWISTINMDPGTYPVTVGSGGPSTGNNPGAGTNGNDSLFGPGTPLPITAKGGGYGAGETSPGAGGPGGSGGGGRDSPYPAGASIQHSENGPLVPLGLMNFGSPGSGAIGGGVAGAGPGGQSSLGGRALINYDFEGDQIGVSPFGAKFGGGGAPRDGSISGAPGGGYGGGGGGGGGASPGTNGIVIVRYLKGYSN